MRQQYDNGNYIEWGEVNIEKLIEPYRLFVADEVTFTITVIILPIPPLVYLSLL